MMEPQLFRSFPSLRGHVAWTSFAETPTPVERLELPGARAIWVKRDDLTAPRYGGNKVRKLEFLIADALRSGSRRIITVGAAGSHHALATALYGGSLGLPVSLVLFPQPLTAHVRDVLITDLALGAELRWAPRMEAVPAAALLARMAHRGERPYVIPGGGSSPLGSLGYVNAALELEQQVLAGSLPEPAVIHLAAGTLGTAAGLAVGLSLGRLKSRIHGVRIVSRLVCNERNLRRLIVGITRILSAGGVAVPPVEEIAERVELSHDSLGEGYGYSTAPGTSASELLAAARLALDPTYTAKAAGAMLDRIASSADGDHLFWHTLSATVPVVPHGTSASELPRSFRRYLGDLLNTSHTPDP